jgi:MOSC domain-containing protein YiiM
MLTLDSLDLVKDQGIAQDPRYFRRPSFGKPAKRQVTLIGCEQLAEHAAALGLKSLPNGIVRSNIEVEGIDLVSLIGCRIRVGEAVLELIEPRTPCSKMDEIAPGLRALMRMANKELLHGLFSLDRFGLGMQYRLLRLWNTQILKPLLHLFKVKVEAAEFIEFSL